METHFGQRVRARRAAQGLTLQSLAHTSGVSVSMLSQVERGERVPTLPVAVRIAEGLGCHLSEILDARGDFLHGTVLRENESGTVDPETGVRRVLLSRQLAPSVAEVTWYRIPAGAHAGTFAHRDPKLVEQVTVIRGHVRVTVCEQVYELQTGDSLTYSGTLEHRFDNIGRGECSLVHLAHRR